MNQDQVARYEREAKRLKDKNKKLKKKSKSAGGLNKLMESGGLGVAGLLISQLQKGTK